jgi:hypothetical protein
VALTSLPAAGAKLRGSVYSANMTERTAISAVKTSDQNVGPSNVTLQDVDDVSVAVAANATYEFVLAIQYSSNTTADIKFGFTFPTGLTMDYAIIGGHSTAEASSPNRGIQTTVLTQGGGAFAVLLIGTVTVGANAGTLQLQSAQNTSTAVTTNVEAGTYLRLTRIS